MYCCKHYNCRKSVTYQLPKLNRAVLCCVVLNRVEYSLCALTRKISMFFLLLFSAQYVDVDYYVLLVSLGCLPAIPYSMFYYILFLFVPLGIFLSRFSTTILYCYCCCWIVCVIVTVLRFQWKKKCDLVQQTNQSTVKGIENLEKKLLRTLLTT